MTGRLIDADALKEKIPAVEDELENVNWQIKWTPIKEVQPTEGGCYLITYRMEGEKPENDQNYVEVDYWDELGKFWQCFDNFVTAWAELPEPYKEAQK